MHTDFGTYQPEVEILKHLHRLPSGYTVARPVIFLDGLTLVPSGIQLIRQKLVNSDSIIGLIVRSEDNFKSEIWLLKTEVDHLDEAFPLAISLSQACDVPLELAG